MAFIMCSKLTAQVCTPAMNADNDSQAPIYGSSICANDVYADGCLNLKVWTSSYGISWDYQSSGNPCLDPGAFFTDFTMPGSISIAQSVDVSIVNANELWAMVVFYDNDTKQFYLSRFKGSSSGTFGFTFNNNISISNVIDFTSYNIDPIIHIDANANGQFAIVYNDPDQGNLQTVAGVTDPINGPEISRVDDLGNSYEASQCDVAISELPTSNEPKIYYAFMRESGDEVNISVDDFSTLISSGSVNTVIETRVPATGYYFRWPRIACPGDVNIVTDWSAVWESVLQNSYYTVDVLGMTTYNGTVYPGSSSTSYYNYTDGSGTITLVATSNNVKSYPVVAYDNVNNIAPLGGTQVIQIAWYGQPDTYGASVIGITTDQYGIVASNTCLITTTPCYEYGSDSPGDEQKYPSLAGRHGLKTNLAFVDEPNTIVVQKDFELCETFKQVPTATLTLAEVKQPNLMVYPNPSNSNVSLKINGFNSELSIKLNIADAFGRIVYTVQGKANNIQQSAGNYLSNLHNGVYFLQVIGQGNRLAKSVVRY
jgi:hypothetical protein